MYVICKYYKVNKFMFHAIHLQELKRSETQRILGKAVTNSRCRSIVKGRLEKASLQATPENCHRDCCVSDVRW